MSHTHHEPLAGGSCGHGRRWRPHVPSLIAASGAAVPMLVMLDIVRGTPKLQYSDYWLMLPSWMGPDGGVRVQGLFSFHNEHPIAVAKLLYLVNSALFAGSNSALGTILVFIVAGQVVMIAALVRRTEAIGRWPKVALVVTASAMLFSRQGAWNFWLAMSGSAWLTANAFAMAALLAQVHRRRGLSIGLAAFASISYGTGLAAWPALVVAGALRDRSLKAQWREVLVGSTVMIGYYLIRPTSIASESVSISDAGAITGFAATLVGGFFFPHDAGMAKVLGLVIGVAGVGLAIVTARRDQRGAAPWSGLLAYGLGATLLIAAGRTSFPDNPTSRYMSLAAISILAVVALLLMNLPSRLGTVLLVPLVVLVGASGAAQVAELRATTVTQRLDSVLFHLDLIDGRNLVLAAIPEVRDRTEAANDYPFARFELGCGRFGDQLAAVEVVEPDEPAGRVTRQQPYAAPNPALRLTGWILPGERDVDCVVVTDQDRTVVGIGSAGTGAEGYVTSPGAPGGAVGFDALAPADDEGLTVLVRFADDPAFNALDPLESDDQ